MTQFQKTISIDQEELFVPEHKLVLELQKTNWSNLVELEMQ